MALTLTAADVNADWNQGAVIQNFAAGEALTVGDAVYTSADDTVSKADANGASESVARAIGVVVAGTNAYGETSIASGQRCSVCVFGKVYGWTGMTANGQVYVSTTAGSLTQTAPSSNAYVFAIGYALDVNVLFINPESDAATSV